MREKNIYYINHIQFSIYMRETHVTDSIVASLRFRTRYSKIYIKFLAIKILNIIIIILYLKII